MGKYLVTGAAGFIGAALATRLIRTGNSVVTIDDLSTGYAENVPEGCELIVGGCQDEAVIGKLGDRKFNAIFHVAGQSSGEISFENPVYDLQSNTQSTILLLKYARETGCRRFVYAGSSLVYGDRGDIALTEDMACAPKSFYGVGKLASEMYMRIHEQYGIKWTSLRLFNVYGPGQNMKNLKQGMVSIYLALALQDRHILVKGSLDRFRDYVYIDDVVNAFLACLVNDTTHGEVFNVGTGRKTLIRELLSIITDALPFDVTVSEGDGTPGDLFGAFGSINKLTAATTWVPATSLETGIKKFVDSLLNK